MPEKFLRAVANLPDCAGIALGMDRLVMLFCNANSIDEVIPFTVDEA
jgi:lysyl-tRNA synthetase class 2